MARPSYGNPPMSVRRDLNKRQVQDIRTRVMQKSSIAMDRVADQANGTLTIKKKIDGEWVDVPYEMTPVEVECCKILLKKTVPDLSLVQQIPQDDSTFKSIEEMEEDLKALAEQSPIIAQLLGLPIPVND